MNYSEMLEAHVRKFDRIAARIREIMLERGYDNDQSPEMRGLKEDLVHIVRDTFILKCCHGRAEGIVEGERKASPFS